MNAYQRQYSEMLKDPRWQKLRLEVMERDGFKCFSCNDNTKTLHVHHICYAKRMGEDGVSRQGAPWETPTTALITLCPDCHSIEESEKRDLDVFLARSFRLLGMVNSDMLEICDAIRVIYLNCDNNRTAIQGIKDALAKVPNR